jgi:hypothetical protein
MAGIVVIGGNFPAGSHVAGESMQDSVLSPT